MNLFTNSTIGRNLVGIPAAILFCIGLFGLGYWQGERAVRLRMYTANAKESFSTMGNGVGRNVGAISPVGSIESPKNNTPEMKEYLQNRATLMQKMTELHQTHPNGPLDPKLLDQFKNDNAALIQRQRDLMLAIEQQQAKVPISDPPALQIPPHASPQLKSYLTTRDQLMRDQIAFLNQHRTDDPATRQAAMQQWRQQNAARFQELQKEVEALAKTKQT